MARGYLGEIETYFLLTKDLNFISEGKYKELDDKRQEVGKTLPGLVGSLK